MEIRKTREFERLLKRTELLEDPEKIKANMIVIEERLAELRNQEIITGAQVSEYFNIISGINKKLQEKKGVATPKKLKEPKIDDDDVSVSEEREKHKELTTEYLKLTESLKEKVAQVGDEMRKDAEAVNNVHSGIDKTLNNAEDAHIELDERSKELWSFKEWKWLAQVIVVFILMQIIFL